MSSRPKFDSKCNKFHPIGTAPCPVCFGWSCGQCGASNEVSAILRCRRCGYSRPMTKKELKLTVHLPSVKYCRACGRKLRNGPRDKRRSMRLKKN